MNINQVDANLSVKSNVISYDRMYWSQIQAYNKG